MGYAVMTTWKHKNPINWNDMEPEIDKMPEGSTVQWFAIDEHNHGSFATYASKEVYEAFKAELVAYRKEASNSLEIEMTMEAIGPIHVDVSNA